MYEIGISILIVACALSFDILNMNRQEGCLGQLLPISELTLANIAYSSKQDYAEWLRPLNNQSDATVRAALHSLDLKGDAIIDLISREYPGLKKLFNSSAQVWEGYSVKGHTAMVFAQFEDQKRFLDLNKLALQGVMNNIERLLRISIALHDIGKPLGPKAEQHQHTGQLLPLALEKWGFTQREIDLACGLVAHDIIGDKIKYRLTTEQAFDALAQRACQASVELPTFFALQHLFYIADASSYPNIRNIHMGMDKKGEIYLKNPVLKELEHLVRTKTYTCCKNAQEAPCLVHPVQEERITPKIVAKL